MNERMNERMTFLDDGGEGGSYSSKPSLFAQHQPYTKEGLVLQILSIVPELASNLGNFPRCN
jgi:hypothetical protein